MTYASPMTCSSTKTGRSAGSANGVTPPIIIPVSSLVSSAEANEHLAPPSSLRTVLLTSRRVEAVTTQTQCFFGSFFDATTMVLPEFSGGKPYRSQNLAVSAKSGSQSSFS